MATERYDGAWYRSALDAVRDFVLVKDTESRLLWANQAFLDYYGMTEAELYDIVDGPQSDPDDTQQYVRDDLQVVQTATDLDVPSEQITDAAGVVRAFHTIKSPVLGEEGVVVRTVGVSRPLDDAEIATSPSHEDSKTVARPLRLITSAFPLAMTLLDVRGRIVSQSDAWISHFGTGQHGGDAGVSDRFPALAALDEPIHRALSSNTAERLQITLEAPAGNQTFDVQIGAWHYDNDELGGAIVVATDITMQAEDQRRLEESNELLRRINNDLDHFTHIAAHDLREPARRQLMLADLINDEYNDELSDGLRELLDHVADQAHGMLRMIDGFRELSNLGGTNPVSAPIHLQKMVDELAAEVLTGEPDLAVSIDLPTEIHGYHPLVRTLFQNLLVNARTHAPRPSTLVLDHEVKNGVVTFRAANPLGDEPPPSGDVFQPFVSRRGGTGEGLGLSICRRVVEHHRGSIWLDDDPTTFSVRFTLEERR